MTEKNKKYQIIKFDSFDFLIILMFKKISTHRPTDRQTFGLIEATCRRLKIGSELFSGSKKNFFEKFLSKN